MELHYFDRNETAAIVERRLPHWSQAGVMCFITFRTSDSMPKNIVERWHLERKAWLRDRGVDPNRADWQLSLQTLDEGQRAEFYSTFSTRWHHDLDSCYGACVLKESVNAVVVADSLKKFDGERYLLTDFVIMPNHVHLLTAFQDDDSMLKQCEEWKRFTGRKINASVGTSGRFWQQDGFDHLVRSEAQFTHFRRYIADNPGKANLKQGQYILYSK